MSKESRDINATFGCPVIINGVHLYPYPTALVDDLLAALTDVTRMLKAAHMQLGMRVDTNKRIIAADAVIARAHSPKRNVSLRKPSPPTTHGERMGRWMN